MNTLRLCLILLLCAVASCGWQLRGAGSYQGPTAIALVAEDQYSPLTLAVREAMRRSSVSDRPDAPLQLHLRREELQKRVVAVTSIGSPLQYEMSLAVRFHYQVPADAVVSLPQVVSVERVFDFDPSTTAAKREEENTLLDEMRRELAQRLLQQARSQQLPPQPSHGQT